MNYNATTVLHHFLNVIMDWKTHYSSGRTSFTINNDDDSEVNTQVDRLREISKYYSVSDTYHPCICSVSPGVKLFFN